MAARIEKPLKHAQGGKRILNRVLNRIRQLILGFIHRFKDGSIGTKIAHVIMGSGNIYHKQYIKGLIYFLLQIVFISIFLFNPRINNTPIGSQALRNFITLGTEVGDLFGSLADNSMLMLLFGVVTFGLIIVYIALYFSNLKSSYLSDIKVSEGKKPSTFKEDLLELLDSRFHILLLTPTILGVLTFTILPTFFMIFIAFTNFDREIVPGLNLFEWVGLQNFTDVFTGQGEIATRFIPVLTWTLTWAFFATFSCYIGGILLALVINKPGVQFKKFWRTVFILTIALPQFISLLAMQQILSENGPINATLLNLGIIDQPFAFLGQARTAFTARVSVILINLWIGIPYTMLMTSGILMNIPKDTYEAAQIDGANKLQVFRSITLPYIIFVTTPYLITSFIGNITSFNIIFLLTGGDPNIPGSVSGQTDLLVTWLYTLTIEEGDVNIGSVIAIFTFIITASATLLTYRRSKAYKEEDTFQ